MKKNDIFTFTAPNGAEVIGVVVAIIGGHEDTLATYTHYLCYAKVPYADCAKTQLFKYVERDEIKSSFASCTLLVECAILPDYNRMLEDYYHQLDMADDYASREV